MIHKERLEENPGRLRIAHAFRENLSVFWHWPCAGRKRTADRPISWLIKKA